MPTYLCHRCNSSVNGEKKCQYCNRLLCSKCRKTSGSGHTKRYWCASSCIQTFDQPHPHEQPQQQQQQHYQQPTGYQQQPHQQQYNPQQYNAQPHAHHQQQPTVGQPVMGTPWHEPATPNGQVMGRHGGGGGSFGSPATVGSSASATPTDGRQRTGSTATAAPSPAVLRRKPEEVGVPLPTVPVDSDEIVVQFPTSDRIPVWKHKVKQVLQQAGVTNKDDQVQSGECVEFIVMEPPSSGQAPEPVTVIGVIAGATNGTIVVMERNPAAEIMRSPTGGRTPNNTALPTSALPYIASCVPPEAVTKMQLIRLGRCRHCGCMIPFDESSQHVARFHRSGPTGTTFIDKVFGICCGDVELLKALIRKRKLGQGAQGEVWLCEVPADHPGAFAKAGQLPPPANGDVQKYVIKEIKCSATDPDDAKRRYEQSVRLMALNHDHIVTYIACQRPPDGLSVRIVMPCYSEGSLAQKIQRDNKIDEGWILSIVLQLASALRVMHSHVPPIIHGDIKPDNIMMYNRGTQVVLMDLDTATEIQHYQRGPLKAGEGTSAWMAPEAINESKLSEKSDIWSMGLVIYCLLVLPDFPTRKNPKSNAEEMLNTPDWRPTDLTDALTSAIVSRGYSGSIANLVVEMMSHTPSVRPTAQQLTDRVTELYTKLLMGEA